MGIGTELHYTIILKARHRAAGITTNNFTLTMPISLPSFTNYYKIKLVSAILPLPTHDTVAETACGHYKTEAVEVLCDFGGRTNSYDTSRSSLQSYGFLNVPKSNHNFSSCTNLPSNPEHIISNLRFSTVRIELKDSSGNDLKQTAVSGGAQTDPEEGIFCFQFTPIRIARS